MRIVIADDHALFRDSLRGLLELEGLEVVGEAETGQQACDLARELVPDVLLMDLQMPGVDGLTATRIIHGELPAIKIVVLTASHDDTDLFEAVRSGAEGYLLKDINAERFIERLKGIDRGEPAITPDLARKLLNEFASFSSKREDPDALTPREIEVLEVMVSGTTSNRAMAKVLRVSENTIKFHIRNIFDKLHMNSRAQVVGHALREGLVTPPETSEES